MRDSYRVMSKIGILSFATVAFNISSNVSAASDQRKMNLPPFNSSHGDESNGGNFMSLCAIAIETCQ